MSLKKKKEQEIVQSLFCQLTEYMTFKLCSQPNYGAVYFTANLFPGGVCVRFPTKVRLTISKMYALSQKLSIVVELEQ